MFDAVIAKKARMEKILHDAKRNPREDLVTSCLFGMLRLLTPDSRQAALSTLCAHTLPSDAIIYLWPFFVGEGEASEPDVVLEFRLGEQRVFWIIEVKWGAPLGADQCAREIRTVVHGHCRRGNVPDGERKVLGYTLLGAEPQHQHAMDELRRTVRNGLENVPFEGIKSLRWTEASAHLQTLENDATDPGLKAWSRLSSNFLVGQPEGALLGRWPTMTMPEEGGFIFNSDEQFYLPPMTDVPANQYHFGVNE